MFQMIDKRKKSSWNFFHKRMCLHSNDLLGKSFGEKEHLLCQRIFAARSSHVSARIFGQNVFPPISDI